MWSDIPQFLPDPAQMGEYFKTMKPCCPFCKATLQTNQPYRKLILQVEGGETLESIMEEEEQRNLAEQGARDGGERADYSDFPSLPSTHMKSKFKIRNVVYSSVEFGKILKSTSENITC